MAHDSRGDKLRVFISYSRRDSVVADAIVAALKESGIDVVIDTRDLPFGERWQAELADFIRLSDTVIWLVSEASLRSEWVNWELDEVKARNKRLVPVMVEETRLDALPRQIGEIHILPAGRSFDLARDIETLVEVLKTDRVWIKQASRLQDRATEWLANARSKAMLLSRGALLDAELWKERRPSKAPAPAQEVLDLLHASRQAANRRQRNAIGASLLAAVVAIVLAGIAFNQRNIAVSAQKTAESERAAAINQQIKAVSANATAKTDAGDAVKAVNTLLEAWRLTNKSKATLAASAERQFFDSLSYSLYRLRERPTIQTRSVKTPLESNGTKLFFPADQVTTTFRTSGPNCLREPQKDKAGADGPCATVSVEAKPSEIRMTWSSLVASIPLEEGEFEARISPDGQSVVTGHTIKGRTSYILRFVDANMPPVGLTDEHQSLFSADFTPDSRWLITSRKRRPALQHVICGLGDVVAAREFGAPSRIQVSSSATSGALRSSRTRQRSSALLPLIAL